MIPNLKKILNRIAFNHDATSMFWILLFLNASGTWTSWIILGPYITSDHRTLLAFGLVALIRQMFAFIGTLAAESWNGSQSARAYTMRVELTLMGLNALALAAVWTTTNEQTLIWVAAWSLCRFFLGGFGLVFCYRLILELGKGNTQAAAQSLIGQLAVNQGSVIVGAALSFGLAFLPIQMALTLALTIDMGTSGALAVWLHRLPESAPSAPAGEQFLQRIKGAVFGFTKGLPLKNLILFLLTLLSLTSLPTIFLFASRQSGNSAVGQFYSVMNLINGGFILFAAWGLNFYKKGLFVPRYFFTAGMVGAVVGCALWLGGMTNGYWALVFSSLLSFGSTAALLSAHGLVMSGVDLAFAPRVRSGMALSLNLIFGFGELVCASLADRGVFGGWITIKMVAGLAALVMVWWPKWRDG